MLRISWITQAIMVRAARTSRAAEGGQTVLGFMYVRHALNGRA